MQERFCEGFVINLNATQAAKDAGFSEKSASTQANELLKKPAVRAKIDALILKRSKRTGVTADKVLLELWRLASTDITEAYDDKGKLKDLKTLPKNLRRAIASVDTYEEREDGYKIGETKKLKLWPKDRALEMLGRHFKLFTDKVEHGLEKTLEDLLTASKEDE